MSVPDPLADVCWAMYDSACTHYDAGNLPEAEDLCRRLIMQPSAPYLTVFAAYWLLSLLPGNYATKRLYLEQALSICHRMRRISSSPMILDKIQDVEAALDALDRAEAERTRLDREREEELLDALDAQQQQQQQQVQQAPLEEDSRMNVVAPPSPRSP